MRNLSFALVGLTGLTLGIAQAQIITQTVTPSTLKSKIKANHRPSPVSTKSFVVAQTEVNRLLDEDKKQAELGFPFRFGKVFDVDLGLEQGKWTEIEEGRVWQLQISAPKAYHLNFQFDKFRLAKGAELIIYNADQSVEMGPITAEMNNGYNTFATDVIRGDAITIELFEPRGLSESSLLHLSKVIYGYKNIQEQAGYGQSLGCEVNINCPAGSAYQTVANSVAMVLLAGGNRICSSTLLNNNCLNFRPYMLTAFHCMDNNCDNALSQTEINDAQNWVFRFKYRSPNCSPTTEPSVYFSYPGSTFRSANAGTDYALLELNQIPSAASGIAYAGWTRSATAPTSAAIISHPNGDVMKIALATAAPSLNSSVLLFANACGTQSGVAANTHWRVAISSGATEGGSSGSGYFDQNGRIFGQHHAGGTCAPDTKSGGAFHVSWTGGGTSQTRLSDWLSNDPNVQQVDAITSIPSVSGPSFFCTTAQFVLSNAPAGAPVTWSVSPSSAVSPSTGSGTTANVTAVGGADATITFFVGCNPTGGFTYNFHCGDYSSSNYSISGPSSAGCNQTVYYSTNQLPGATSYTWFWPSNWSYQSGQNTYSLAVRTGTTGGQVGVRVAACGGSGGSPSSMYTSVSGCGARIAVYPNPSSHQVQVEFDQTDSAEGLPEQLAVYSEHSTRPVKVINVRDIYDHKAFRDGNKVDLDVRDLPRGVYYIHFTGSKQQAGAVERVRIVLN